MGEKQNNHKIFMFNGKDYTEFLEIGTVQMEMDGIGDVSGAIIKTPTEIKVEIPFTFRTKLAMIRLTFVPWLKGCPLFMLKNRMKRGGRG